MWRKESNISSHFNYGNSLFPFALSYYRQVFFECLSHCNLHSISVFATYGAVSVLMLSFFFQFSPLFLFERSVFLKSKFWNELEWTRKTSGQNGYFIHWSVCCSIHFTTVQSNRMLMKENTNNCIGVFSWIANFQFCLFLFLIRCNGI